MTADDNSMSTAFAKLFTWMQNEIHLVRQSSQGLFSLLFPRLAILLGKADDLALRFTHSYSVLAQLCQVLVCLSAECM